MSSEYIPIKEEKQNQILLVFSVLVSASAITNIFKWLPEIVIVPLMAFLALTLTYFTTKYKAENLERRQLTAKDLLLLCTICAISMRDSYQI